MTSPDPAAGHPLLQTAADPSGTRVLGTFNNCAMGFTPWGTYLACEENFNGYFRKTTPPARSRAGTASPRPRSTAGTRPTPASTLDVEPNEPNRFGWVVEIDPFDSRLDAGEAHRRSVG